MGGVREAGLTVFVIVAVGLLVVFGNDPTTRAQDKKKGCFRGVCPTTCCRSLPGIDLCCCLSPAHTCKCPPKPIDPSLWDEMTKDFGG